MRITEGCLQGLSNVKLKNSVLTDVWLVVILCGILWRDNAYCVINLWFYKVCDLLVEVNLILLCKLTAVQNAIRLIKCRTLNGCKC